MNDTDRPFRAYAIHWRPPEAIPSTLVCPCCKQIRDVATETPLPAIETHMRDTGSDPDRRPPGWSVAVAARGELYWACSRCIEGGAALVGQPWRQRWRDFEPYLAYYDHRLHCEDCDTDFIFAAAEQHWYETLRFWVQAYPKQCLDCRRKRRDHQRLMREQNGD
jgi:Probable zinc-ribbon domain